jgi:hypothetical protein
MPPLKLGKTTSFFEFWPTWLIYIPVAVQWLGLSIRYKSLTLPLIANPQLPLSGMVGISKGQLLAQAKNELSTTILPWLLFARTEQPADTDLKNLIAVIEQAGFNYPFVCKPDIGCRGVGVKLIHSQEKLLEAVKSYPVGANMMIQRLADYEPEAGIFYVRHPNSQQGQIISMALKYMPYVIGDGEKTLAELIDADERASELKHLYQSRHQSNWYTVIEKNTPYRLVFSASHSKGAIFKDAKDLITPELTQKLNTLMQQLPEFHYGRLDVKFKDVESLQQGDHLQIVEINTASSESLHIWDSNTGFIEAVRSLLFQYRTLFTMGAANRIKGYQPPGMLKLLKHWRLERQLTKFYPETD